MNLEVLIVVEARPRSLFLRIPEGVVCVPRFAVLYGEFIEGGDRGLSLDVATGIYQEIQEAIRRHSLGKRTKDGREAKLIDCQAEIWSENKARRELEMTGRT